MNVETQLQRKIVHFCSILPAFIDNWQQALKESEIPTRAFYNRAEQLRHVERYYVKNLKKTNFKYENVSITYIKAVF